MFWNKSVYGSIFIWVDLTEQKVMSYIVVLLCLTVRVIPGIWINLVGIITQEDCRYCLI